MSDRNIRQFIIGNNLLFSEGNRNSSIVVLVGYAQHLDMTISELKEELKPEINVDIFIAQEIERLWDYCLKHNYRNFWTSKKAKLRYNFVNRNSY